MSEDTDRAGCVPTLAQLHDDGSYIFEFPGAECQTTSVFYRTVSVISERSTSDISPMRKIWLVEEYDPVTNKSGA